MIEQEYKWMTDEETFLRILQDFSARYEEKIIQQKNYYYDTEDLCLYHQGVTLRVREKNGSFSMQTKAGRLAGDGFRKAEETHRPIDGAPDGIPSTALNIPGETEFFLLGCLCTERHRFQLTDAVQLDCDRSTYQGATDYEVELEFTGQAPAELLAQFHGLMASKLSKYQRFLKQMGLIK